MAEVDPDTRNPREILEEKLREKGYELRNRDEPYNPPDGPQIVYHILFAGKGDEEVRLGVQESILENLQHFLSHSTAFNTL